MDANLNPGNWLRNFADHDVISSPFKVFGTASEIR